MSVMRKMERESFENNSNSKNSNSQNNMKKSKHNRVFGQNITNFVSNQQTSNAKNISSNSNDIVKNGPFTKLSTQKTAEEPVSSGEIGLILCDKNDINNELASVDYISSIMHHLRESELVHELGETNDYMQNLQPDISARMRGVLLDWIVEVHLKFKLSNATLYLAVNILDRYLSKKQSSRSVLQLTGCACLWIACKYHEIYAPEIRDFVYISDNAFSKNDLINCEAELMDVLDFQLTVPTTLSFAQRFIKVGTYTMNPREQRFVQFFTLYLLEHCLMDYNMVRKLPSEVASAAIAFTLLVTRFRAWDAEMVSETQHTLTDLLPILQYMNNMVNNKQCKHKAVRKKYCSSKFEKVEHVLKKLIPIDILRYVRHAQSKMN